MVDVAFAAIPSIAEIIGIIAIATILYNVARRMQRYDDEKEVLKAKEADDFKEAREKAEANHKESLEKIHNAALERHDEINKAVLDTKDGFTAIQKQLDSKTAEIKDVGNRVTQLLTQVQNLCDALDEVKQGLRDDKGFNERWNQRIEDRVTASEARCDRALSDTRTELMKFIDMMIAFKNGLK